MFYTPLTIPPLLDPPVKRSAIALTVNVIMKMGLQGDQGLLSLLQSLGFSVKDSDRRKLHKVHLLSALKSCFKALHREEKSNYHDSSCFQAPKQNIDHEWNN
jgi:hypothetical protein